MGERPNNSPARVLVVEDEAEFRTSLVECLRRHGFAVTAVEGRSGLHMLEESGPFQALVCDLHLNQVDSRLVLGLAQERNIPSVVVAPAYAEFEAREACMLGADSVWALPVDTERFVEKISELTLDAQPDSPTPSTRKVLLIDDNEDTRISMRRTLESASYTVLDAENGIEGIRQASLRRPDLIILDIVMPGMDGLAVCEVLKTQRATAHIPVLMCTVRSGKHSQIQAIAAAADGYLVKPFRPEELLAHVAQYVPAETNNLC